jgi:hypothetical protein
MRKFSAVGRVFAPAATTVLAALVLVSSASAAAPGNTAPPAVSGTAKGGQTLTVSNGTWTGSPTSYTYQWQRCSSASSCVPISGATQKTYTVVSADSGRTLRAVVSASNEDGVSTANSNMTETVPPASGVPASTAAPSIDGDAVVGESLQASHGTWSNSPTAYGYQWLRCDFNGDDCFAVPGATGSAYGVRFGDVYFTLRVEVRARNANGVATARSAATEVVQPLTPVVVAGNKSPKLRIHMLRRVGLRAYARFTVCDDSGRISVIERDSKPRTLAYARKFAVTTRSCVTASRMWTPAPRFRTKGHFVVTLRAVDKSGQSSSFVSRALLWR